MLTREIERCGLRLSRLGFGCVSLTTHARTADALRLLHAALDSGITHFDVARLYGFGRAEGILGEFLRTVARDRVTVTTKVGLTPPAALARRPALVRLGKRLLHHLPGLRASVQRRLRRYAPAPRFSAHHPAASLEVSLQSLGTDYVDLLLLHEAELSDASAPEILEFLDRVVRAGRIRAYGVASHSSRLGGDLTAFPAGHSVFQFNNSALAGEIAFIDASGDKLLITHSALAPLALLRRTAASNSPLVREWSARLDTDLANESVLADLLLSYALQTNERGVVLFATMHPGHLQANVRRALERRHSQQQIALFCDFCRLLAREIPA